MNTGARVAAVADLLLAARMGESEARRDREVGAEAIHRRLAEKTFTDETGDLHKTAYVSGYLRPLGPAAIQDLLIDAYLENPTLATTNLYTQAYFPPALRTVAAIFKHRPDSQGLEIAEGAASGEYFTLLDQPETFEVFAARDTYYSANTVLWALPEAEPEDEKLHQLSESYDTMLELHQRQLGTLRSDINCRVGAPSLARLQTGTRLDIYNSESTMAKDFLAGMRREQVAAAVYSNGKRPLHALVTNWPGLVAKAESVGLDGPLVDQIFHFVPSTYAMSGDATTTGRTTTVPVELETTSKRFDGLFPLHRLDLDRVARIAHGARRLSVIGARARRFGAMATHLGQWPRLGEIRSKRGGPTV